MVFKNMNEWFSSNLLSLNFGKTHFTQFLAKHSSCNTMYINYNVMFKNYGFGRWLD